MRALCRSPVVKRELSRKAKLSIYLSRWGEELGHSGRARSRAAAPPHREEPVEVARASIPDASWTPSSGGVPGTSHREEAQGTAQDTLEGLCLSAGLGTPWAPPGGAGGGVWGEGPLGVCCPRDPVPDKAEDDEYEYE
ncbi:hypothetical protein CRENBAI_024564 [Crenichthys baileyi]|uniref:Uncharacterized protein n=1 Tax=Crenichthys baileyi TaxID=28760 RepID=A0AAV9QYZ1_9TELE